MTTTRNATASLPEVVSHGIVTVGGIHTLKGAQCEKLDIGGYEFFRVLASGAMFEPCRRCDGSGHLEHYSGIYGGVCFECNGGGAHAGLGTLDDVRERVRRRVRDRAARAARAERAAAAARESARVWNAARPNLARDLEAVRASVRAGDDTHDGFVHEMAFLAERAPLSVRQEEAVTRALAVQAASDAWHDVQAATATHAGAIGDVVSVTGTVTVAMYLRSDRFDRSDSMLIVIQAGSATCKMTTGAKWAFTVERDQEITVRATVKAHGEYNGLPQTVLARPKMI